MVGLTGDSTKAGDALPEGVQYTILTKPGDDSELPSSDLELSLAGARIPAVDRSVQYLTLKMIVDSFAYDPTDPCDVTATSYHHGDQDALRHYLANGARETYGPWVDSNKPFELVPTPHLDGNMSYFIHIRTPGFTGEATDIGMVLTSEGVIYGLDNREGALTQRIEELQAAKVPLKEVVVFSYQ